MTLSGTKATTQAGTVYVKQSGTFDRFEWLGAVTRLDESTNNIGGLTLTTAQNPRGGIMRDGVNQDVPGTVDFSIVMKQLLGNRKKTELLKCWFNVDRRTMCGGRDRDDPFAWKEIVRKCYGKATTRTTPATSWEGEEDALITIPFSALDEFDIYQVTYQDRAAASAIAFSMTDVAVCHNGNCPTCGDTEAQCTLVAVTTMVVAGSPYIMTNLAGGDVDNWTSQIISEWTTAGADAVLCMGSFLGIVSNGEAEIIRSDDRGVTRVQITHASFAANPPNDLDGIDQCLIFVVGDNGHVYASFDGLRTIEISDAGSATAEDLNRVMIARDNFEVAYAVGAANAIIKTENAGITWTALTGPSPTDSLLEVWVADESHLLVVNDDGELWESSDGGVTWIQQSALPSISATLTEARIQAADCDVYYLTATDGTNSFFYRNVEGAADGYWQLITSTPVDDIHGLAVCDGNKAVVVGGSGTTANMAGLVS